MCVSLYRERRSEKVLNEQEYSGLENHWELALRRGDRGEKKTVLIWCVSLFNGMRERGCVYLREGEKSGVFTEERG